MKQLNTYAEVKASLGSTKANKKFAHCIDGISLVKAWRDEQASLGRWKALSLSKENWQDFYAHAHRMVAKRNRESLKASRSYNVVLQQDSHLLEIKSEV